MQELPVPKAAIAAEQADEVLRAWIVDEHLLCTLRPSFWKEEPEVWGILLADALHHMCDALSKESGQDKVVLKRLMVEAFMLEVEAPSAECEGEFHKD